MSLRRVRAADWIAGAVGLVTVLALWLDWFQTPGLARNAWEAFALTDLVLALAGLLGLALPIVTAAARTPAIPVAVEVVAAALAAVGLLLVLLALVSQPGANEETAILAGGWLGALSVAGLLAAAWLAMRNESSPGIGSPTEFPLMPVPPPGGGSETGSPPTVST